ncbi:hypothetical protein Cflav_PD5411 [Pedosphaera parvula Ellin514]|uniref:Uncharacterized protein n=1 Tax=Pedosphaera parvula (strain Ellin514) TaxID=320771 RepID=B9XB91_PEDPL|nr:hypothetical protein Cflav_PD5411 [Pedosphaera parvula Ellin514]
MDGFELNLGMLSSNYTDCRKKFPDGRRDFGLRQGGGCRRYP